MSCRCPIAANLSSEPCSPLVVSRGSGWSRSYLEKSMSVTVAVLASARSMKCGDDTMRSRFACASSSVSARIGYTRNSTLMSSGLRPNDTAWRRTSSRYCFMPSMPFAVAMIESACFAANARPRGEPPACTNTGLPLRRAHRVQRAAALEILALEMDRSNLAVVGIGAGRAIHHHRIRSHESNSLQTRSTYSSAIS